MLARFRAILLTMIIGGLFTGCVPPSIPEPTSVPTHTPSSTVTSPITPTRTPTSTSTSTLTPTRTWTLTPTPTFTPTATPTSAPTRTRTPRPQPTSYPSACPVSTNRGYGYNEKNPIKVGGDWLAGPSRERAYLDVLRGPAGQAIQYDRLGSKLSGDVILDIYQLTYDGLAKPIILYVDEYNYESLRAPAGLSCTAPIPLGQP